MWNACSMKVPVEAALPDRYVSPNGSVESIPVYKEGDDIGNYSSHSDNVLCVHEHDEHIVYMVRILYC